MLRTALFFIIAVFLAGSVGTAGAFADEASVITNEIKTELQAQGAAQSADIKGVDSTLRSLITKGMTKEDAKQMLKDLIDNGINGSQLRKTLSKTEDLVKNGEDPKTAGNIVSQAAHDAKAQGLKGRDLAAKVHEAIKLRKDEKNRLKKAKKEAKGLEKQKAKEEEEKIKKEQAELEEATKEARKKSEENASGEDEEFHGPGKGKGKNK